MKNKKIYIVGILGIGKVGKAIYKLTKQYYRVLTKDINIDQLEKKSIDIFHVCIPYSTNFSKIVIQQILINKPKLVIIHSTIKPGTTRNIYNITKTLIVHSPIIGVHPKLYFYLFKFPAFIGPINKTAGQLAFNYFQKMRLKPFLFNNPEETELAKLLDTGYYGINIVFCKWVKELCDEYKLNFDNIYKRFNHAYNQGYANTLPNVQRPVLKPVLGPIGGDCIVPNGKILAKFIPGNPVSNLINFWEKRFQ